MFLKTIEKLSNLQQRIKNFLTRKPGTVVKTKNVLYYAFEPARKLVHIIQGQEMLDKMLKILSSEDRTLLPFSDGKLYRQLPSINTRLGLKINPGEYEKVQTWGGGGKSLTPWAYFSMNKIYFQITNSSNSESAESDIDFPDLDVGTLFSNRAAILDTLFTKINIADFVDSVGQNMDPDFRSRLIHEISDSLNNVKQKLYPTLG